MHLQSGSHIPSSDSLDRGSDCRCRGSRSHVALLAPGGYTKRITVFALSPQKSSRSKTNAPAHHVTANVGGPSASRPSHVVDRACLCIILLIFASPSTGTAGDLENLGGGHSRLCVRAGLCTRTPPFSLGIAGYRIEVSSHDVVKIAVPVCLHSPPVFIRCATAPDRRRRVLQLETRPLLFDDLARLRANNRPSLSARAIVWKGRAELTHQVLAHTNITRSLHLSMR